MTGRLSGKAAIVTGGASGIGAAVARRFVEEGAEVLICDRDEAAAVATVARIGGKVTFRHHDVTQETEWDRLNDDLAQRHWRPDTIVNNAAIGTQAGRDTPEDGTLEEWRRMLSVNGESVFLGCRFGIRAMRDQGGSIINMSSIAALIPSPEIAAYGFAKAGVDQFSRSVALHCARAGYKIRCNAVHPGQIMTPMLEGLFRKAATDAQMTPDETRAGFLSKIPIGEFGTVDDVANAIVFLASDEAKHVTGIRLVIDGGMQLSN